MNKRIILSGGMLVFMAAIVAGGTGAFFSDTETSENNVFTAGSVSIDLLEVDHVYNGADQNNAPVFDWMGGQGRFTLDDLKPLDTGMLDLDLENGANEAHVCALIAGNPGDLTEPNDVALYDQLNFFIDGEDTQVVPGEWFDLGTVAPNSPVGTGVDYCFGDSNVDGSGLQSCDYGDGSIDYNAAQNGSFAADLIFYAIQTRNNENFSCDQLTLDGNNEPVYTPGDVDGPAVGAVLGDYTDPAGSCDETVTSGNTIQSGIAGLNGDSGTVCVEDGIYAGDVITTGTGQTIVALNPQGATIDGGVRLVHDDAVLQGFVITGTENTAGVGGNAFGVAVQADNVDVFNNQIVGDYTAQVNNQGVVVDTSGVSGTEIVDNTVTGFHSGIYLNPSSNVLVKWNDLFGNTVGLSSDNPSGHSVTLNDIRNNTAEGVGLLFNIGDSIGVNQNNITNNGASDEELANYGSGTPDVTNNWWGDLNGSDDTDSGSGSVTFAPEATSEFAHR